MACGLTLIKRMTYRGDASEEWSNQYWFTGSTPADATAWNTLKNALLAQEKTCYPSTVEYVGAYGYASDAEDATAVWSADERATPTDGTLSTSGGVIMPGDAAVWVRWKTSRVNSNAKPIYLRKYFHGAVCTSGTPDTILPGQKTALEAFGTELMDGSFLDARTITARGESDTITVRAASAFITTRTLKRRGKRPGA